MGLPLAARFAVLAGAGSALAACSFLLDAGTLSEGQPVGAVDDEGGLDGRPTPDAAGPAGDAALEDVAVVFDTSPGPCGDGVVNPGEQCDLGAANGTAGTCCTTSCTFLGSASVCRAAAGVCDVAEKCTGASPACPTNAFVGDGTACTPPLAGACRAGTCEPIGGAAAYWSFDETTGATAADSIGANTGTLTNGATWTASGQIKGALLLDGVDDYVVVADSASLEQAGDLTIAVWVYPTNVAKDRQSIVNKSVDHEYEVIMEPGGKLSFYQGAGLWEEILEPDGWSVTQAVWTHVAITRTVATKELVFYANGAVSGTATFAATPTASTLPVQLGTRDGIYYFEGRMDDARVYSRALTAAEISRLAAAR